MRRVVAEEKDSGVRELRNPPFLLLNSVTSHVGPLAAGLGRWKLGLATTFSNECAVQFYCGTISIFCTEGASHTSLKQLASDWFAANDW